MKWMNEKIRKNVDTLLGNPKKAIIKFSIPMMIGSLIQTLYNFVDGVFGWQVQEQTLLPL